MILPRFDYMFKNFKDMYEVVNNISYPLFGIYNIRVDTKEYSDIFEFLKNETKYSTMAIYIITSKDLIQYTLLRKPNAIIFGSKSSYRVYLELIESNKLYFSEGCINSLYWSIPHTYGDLESVINELKLEYGDRRITMEMLERLYVIDTKVFPKSVTIAYILMTRDRHKKLNLCLSEFGNDMTFYSMQKSVKEYLKLKTIYLKTGESTPLVKSMSTKNILLMMKTFVYENNDFKNVTSLLKLYERGGTINDIIYERTKTFSYEEYNTT